MFKPGPLSWSEPPTILRYGAAVAAVAVALAGGLLLQYYLEISPLVSLFLCAVLFAAWLGGLGPGLLAIALGLLALGYFFLPFDSPIVRYDDAVRMAFFAVTALFVAVLCARQRSTAQSLRRARDDLQAAVSELGRVNASLRAENADRQRAEVHLAEAQRELQLMLDLIPTFAWQTRSDGYAEYLNKRWLDYTGLAIEQALGWEWQVAIHPEDLPGLLVRWREMLTSGNAKEVEARMRRHDGEYRWFLFRPAPLRDDTGNVVRWYGTNTDIEDRKRAEDALRRSEACLVEAQRLSVIGSLGWRIPSNIMVWSKETYRIFDIDIALEPTIQLVLDRTHPDDVAFVQRCIERMASEDRDFDFEHRLILPDGTVKHLHVRTHRVRLDTGEVEIVGALMDVTAARKAEEDLRRAQAELAHANRVATLGELSASIAHEVNQPLTGIVTNGEAAMRWLNRDAPEKDHAVRAITRMISEAHRAGQVIRRIRDLSKKAEPAMSLIDINSLVEEAVTLVRVEAVGQLVSVRLQLASGLPPARGDKVQLQQVLINLVMNGIQAMAPITDRARLLLIRTLPHGADQVLVAVEDAGVGIESENLNRLFGAFYTTKPDGMGLGLSISRSIVEAHGGRVWAARNDGPGMTFQFTLSAYREVTSDVPQT